MTTHDKLLADQNHRVLAISNHDRSMLVEAGAGSGKTALLAGRVAMMLASGIAPQSIAAVTFTELAASELASRVADVVSALLSGTIPVELAPILPDGLTVEQRCLLERAEGQLDELTCTTIHGFCQRLITPYPVEADIDPGAVVIDRAEADRIFSDLLNAWLRQRLSVDGSVITEMVLAGPEDTVEKIKELANCLRENHTVVARAAEPVDALAAEFVANVAAFDTFVGSCPVREADTIATLEALQAMASFRLPTGRPDHATLIGLLITPMEPRLCRKDGGFLVFKGGKGKWQAAAKAAAMSKDDGTRLQLVAEKHYLACCEVWLRLKANLASEVLVRLADEIRPALEQYRLKKRIGGLLDFDDLISSASRLLREHEPVRRALAERFSRVLVDEFQDTDPIQTEIFWRLCGEAPEHAADGPWHERILRPGALFLVGDPKQAIYRFRSADVAAYVEARSAMEADAEAQVLSISTNFRSSRSIIAYVNARFENILRDKGQPGFAALDHFHEDHGRGPCVATLEVPLVPAGDKPSADEMRDAEAEVVADLCARLIGQALTGHDARLARPVRPGDIALLAPQGTDLWRYEEALERRGIPVATQAGKGFFRRQEVQDLIAITRILADPRDTLALGSFLRGPVVGLTDEELLDIVHALPRPQETPDERADDADPEYRDQRIPKLNLHLDTEHLGHSVARDVFERLQTLARSAAATTPHDILSRAVDALMLRPIVLNRHAGNAERALANIDLYLEQARPFAVRGLRAFARSMEASWKEDRKAPEGRPDAPETAVGLITMHSSKGLEWPIVIPVNTSTMLPSRSGPVIDRAEGYLYSSVFGFQPMGYDAALSAEKDEISRERIRLWYVAATRAREFLILPRFPMPPAKPAWSTIMDLDLSAQPAIDVEALALPPRQPDRVLSNGQNAEIFAAEAASIVGLHRHLTCRTPSRDGAAAVGAAPEPDIVRPNADDLSPIVQGSRARGTLIHKLIEECLTGETAIDETAAEARARELIESLGLVPADDPASGPCPAEIARCSVKALLQPAVAAIRPRLRPELPVYRLVSKENEDFATFGVVDALACDETGHPETVVDWKSDVAPSPATVASYMGQIAEYRDMTGARRGLLVFVTTGQVLEVA